jgi:hypothetical protein
MKTENKTICGADCSQCGFKETCHGCTATDGCPFGGSCVAALYIKKHGKSAYEDFKAGLVAQIDSLLAPLGIPAIDNLNELPGFFVDLKYTLPNGAEATFLNPNDIYLGNQICVADNDVCYGVIADEGFILICSYRENGADPQLLIYKRLTKK